MSVLDAVTPVILTRDEEPNLGRLLDDLRWARRVVVVDSISTDRTAEVAAGFPNVHWVERPFDSHGAQWRFAVDQVNTDYVLALDADYRVPEPFVAEVREQVIGGGYAGAIAGFRYCIHGQPLRGSVYPAKIVLFRRAVARITQAGHSQAIAVEGPVYQCRTRLVHDDRKPLARFVASQMSYARLEADRLETPDSRRWQDRVRRMALMPFIAAPGAYLAAGGPLAGRAAVHYACERTLFECLLVLEMLRRRFRLS